ncbi:MAG TPA: ATPase, T2SS/T4P/T4SS family [Rhodothermales bacterium]|nr:ATPase, T2SS/T4P/T4SS family [Rhodothermales bacterium]
MSYRGLSKDIRKRRHRDEVSDAQDSTKESQPDEKTGSGAASVSSWNEEAQDQLSDLLDDVDDDEAPGVDLAALRQALAAQQEEKAQDAPADEAAAPAEDEPPVVEAASDVDTQQEAPQAATDSNEEPVVRLDWLDKLLSTKRKPEAPPPPPQAPTRPAPKEDPGLAIDALLAGGPVSNGSARPETSNESPEAPEDPAPPASEDSPAEPVREILDLSDHTDFLQLEWNDEPANEGSTPPEKGNAPLEDTPADHAPVDEASVDATSAEKASAPEAEVEATPEPSENSRAVQWTSLADLDIFGFDDDSSTEAAPEAEAADEVQVDTATDNSASDETTQTDSSSFDGSPVDDVATPVPDVADWTTQKTPPAEEAGPVVPGETPVEETVAQAPAESASTEQAPAEQDAPKEPEKAEPAPKIPNVDLEKITSRDRVVAMLLKKNIVEPDEVKIAYARQQKEKSKDPVWRMLATTSNASRQQIFEVAASVYAFKKVEFGAEKPDPEFARSVMETFEDELRDGLLKLRVVPLAVDLDQQTGAIKVVFITHDPTRPEVHRMMQKLKLERFELRYAPENVVTSLMLEAFPRRNEFLERLDEDNAFDLGASYDSRNSELIDEDALEAEISRSKLINLFEATLVEAVRLGASDVHIWPNADKHVEIHMRIDGRLQRWHLEDKIHPEALIAVIKDNSMNVDRFERDAAQDGFIQRWIDEALIRFRVSVLPIANAATDVRSESIVIRVLDDRKVIKDLRKLGLHELSYRRFKKAISQPHGMVILTGPTGSGKTTTLYASLHEVVSPEVNVLTVEDPVEYILPGVRQIKLNNKLGLEGALRSILRHDPDVVMVGEMRDKDTAELAIKLANTGHLTFSTLHTNDAASAVTRLYKMDIEPFLIAYAINLVVAQRLIRRLCTECKLVDPDPDPVLLKNLGFEKEEIESMTFYMQGEDNEHCPKCKGLGFKGRRAVTEALYFSREIRHLIADSEGKLDENDIKDMARKQGMMTLQDSAREVVKEGDTSILEMLRVVATEE